MVFKSGNDWNGNGTTGSKSKRIPPITLTHIKEHYALWVKLIKSDALDAEAKIKALEKLVPFQWAYMYGKPKQSLDISSDKPLAAIVNISLSDPGQAVGQAVANISQGMLDGSSSNDSITISDSTTSNDSNHAQENGQVTTIASNPPEKASFSQEENSPIVEKSEKVRSPLT